MCELVVTCVSRSLRVMSKSLRVRVAVTFMILSLCVTVAPSLCDLLSQYNSWRDAEQVWAA